MTTSERSKGYIYTKTPAHSWWVLLCSALCFMCFFVTMNIPAVFSTVIAEEWAVSVSQISLLTTASMITFAFIPILSTSIASKWSVKKIVIVGMMCNIISSALTPLLGTTWIGYFILRFIQGATGGFMQGALATHLSLWFPRRTRGFATGIMVGFLGVGMSVASFVGPFLTGLGMSWQMANFWIGVVPSIIALVLFCATVKDFRALYPNASSVDDLMPPVPEEKTSHRFDNVPKVNSNREIWTSSRCWCAGLYLAVTAIFTYGLSYALPLFLQYDMGMTLAAASAAVGATFLFKLIGGPVGGFISDKVFKGERFQVCMIGAGVAGVMLCAFPFIPEAIVIPYMCVMFFMGCLFGGTYFTWATEMATPNADYQFGNFITVVSNCGSIVAAPLVGLVVDGVSVTAAIIVVGVVSIISAVMAYFIRV